MKPKTHFDFLKKNIDDYVNDENYNHSPEENQEFILGQIAWMLASIADILEGKNSDAKTENRSDA